MRWLDALHVLDSTFPTGAYAHSLGLESLAPSDLGSALALRLNESVARLELVIVLHAYTLDLLELDAFVHASLLLREQREASSAVGTSLLRGVCDLLDDARLSQFLDEVESVHDGRRICDTAGGGCELVCVQQPAVTGVGCTTAGLARPA